jgi:Holliday junction resolvase
MAGPEKNLYKMVKEKLADYSPIRIETTTVNGFPDLILFNKNKEVLFIECKVCERDKLLQSLRPHQKAFHHKYSKIFDGLFILQRVPSSREVFLYRSEKISFIDYGTAEPCARAADRENWDAIREQLNDRPTISSGIPETGK